MTAPFSEECVHGMVGPCSICRGGPRRPATPAVKRTTAAKLASWCRHCEGAIAPGERIALVELDDDADGWEAWLHADPCALEVTA